MTTALAPARLGMLLGLALCLAGTAAAFVVQGPRRSTGSILEDLAQAPRWDASGGSLIYDGVRGLGGGLEYALDESVCQLRFMDGSTCQDAQRMVAEAVSRWQAGHANLYFTEVTGHIPPRVLGKSQASPASKGQKSTLWWRAPPPFRCSRTARSLPTQSSIQSQGEP